MDLELNIHQNSWQNRIRNFEMYFDLNTYQELQGGENGTAGVGNLL